jgi:hypothetical protein
MTLRDERRHRKHTDQDRCLPAGALAQTAAATGMPGVVRARRRSVIGAAQRVLLSVLPAVDGCGRTLRRGPGLEHGRVRRGNQLAQQHDHSGRSRGRKSRHGRIMARMQLPGS